MDRHRGDAATPGEPPTERPRPSLPPRARTVTRALLGAGFALAVAAGAVSISAFGTPDGFVAQGVAVGNADLGGKSEDDARAALVALAQARAARTVVLSHEGREAHVTAGELGYELDVEATLAQALAAARERGVASAWRSLLRTRTEVDMVYHVDEQAILEQVPTWEVALVTDPPFDGALEVGSGTPEAKLPKTGHRIDRPALVGLIQAELAKSAPQPIAVPVLEVVPPIEAAEVERATEEARLILSGPITLTYAPSDEEIARAKQENSEAEKRHKDELDRQKWRLPKKKSRMKRKGTRLIEEPAAPPKIESYPVPEAVALTFSKEELLRAFRARRVDEPTPHFTVELDEAEVKRKLAPVVAKLFNAARDARFDIDDQSRITIVPSRPGTRVDTSRLVEALYAAAATPERTGALPVDHNAEPMFTTEAAEKLAIKGLVSQFTTHFVPGQPRVKNIHRICSMLDGTIVKAGDTFSVNSAVGSRTLERGFVVAPSIGDGEMTETPGGGVSQFATTLYNALFDGGYVVKEHKPHSFYFSRYPMGIEATLSYPSPDLVFVNDSKAALLLRCETAETHVRVRLFGDNGGRRVERKVSAPFDYTEPKVEYVASRRRKPDEEKVKDRGSNGFTVVTTRVVDLGDGNKREEKRTVKYNGHIRTIEVHPCKIPKGEKGYTGEKCPKEEEEAEGAGGG